GDDLSVESLAELAAMSPRNFARVFARETGVTPGEYVERVRLDAARRLLEDTTTAASVKASSQPNWREATAIGPLPFPAKTISADAGAATFSRIAG
ncbi:helix-turn-helix domain-containing protein, partial [Enterococcus faecium]|uniref:helix-turn-helix domain-containing protein n=1 Tax=Enterococcus faecium TaxID=1352 RepID=UPI0034E95DAD